MSATDTVLRADTKRLHLMEEEERLMAEMEAGNDSNSDRLKQVHEELEAIGAASAESRARRILAVCLALQHVMTGSLCRAWDSPKKCRTGPPKNSLAVGG